MRIHSFSEAIASSIYEIAWAKWANTCICIGLFLSRGKKKMLVFDFEYHRIDANENHIFIFVRSIVFRCIELSFLATITSFNLNFIQEKTYPKS